MSIIVTGSLAFDYVMNFPKKFSDYILPDKIHQINLSFQVEALRKEKGGCAGNIAYNLALLKEKPIIFSSAGKDFGKYKEWLNRGGVDTRFIQIIPDESTAMGFGMTDQDDNQIWGYYLGAMRHNSELSLHKIIEKEVKKPLPPGQPKAGRFGPLSRSSSASKAAQPISKGPSDRGSQEEKPKEPKLNKNEVKMLMIAPDVPEAMMKFVKEAKELYIPYIFDPGMQAPKFDREELLKAIDGARVVIGNDYEVDLIERTLNAKKEHILNLVDYLIITKGPKGSVIYYQNQQYEIPPAIPQTLSDPTGAGDAYRAGVIRGLISKCKPEVIGRIGSLVAVYTVEKYGTTTHSFQMVEFKKRYQETFGEKLEL